MLDLSDYAWLIVVGVWLLVKVVSGVVRSASRRAAAGRKTPSEPAPERFGDQSPERFPEIEAKPIEPR